ncbi:hypothetical protein K461DRAFT_324209 [Myriangium duriaei CBS 260.36]|uniref:Uncharacterized protein n=1 Tax=Myriangium duriaei CBS 260.36 TaxID=1168546 RepID=A0A9P4IU15_9PEZI|nr:hypothetical protein K461DRAFT_324209 [Myriangium duriaei CBS 260.36]
MSPPSSTRHALAMAEFRAVKAAKDAGLPDPRQGGIEGFHIPSIYKDDTSSASSATSSPRSSPGPSSTSPPHDTQGTSSTTSRRVSPHNSQGTSQGRHHGTSPHVPPRDEQGTSQARHPPTSRDTYRTRKAARQRAAARTHPSNISRASNSRLSAGRSSAPPSKAWAAFKRTTKRAVQARRTAEEQLRMEREKLEALQSSKRAVQSRERVQGQQRGDFFGLRT